MGSDYACEWLVPLPFRSSVGRSCRQVLDAPTAVVFFVSIKNAITIINAPIILPMMAPIAEEETWTVFPAVSLLEAFVGAFELESAPLLLSVLPVCTGESLSFKTAEPPPEVFPDPEELEGLEGLEGSELLP